MKMGDVSNMSVLTAVVALLGKANQYEQRARKAKLAGYLKKANEYYLIADTFRDAAKIVEKLEDGDGQRS